MELRHYFSIPLDMLECFEADDVGKVKAYDWVSEGCPRLGEL